jgi:hypothetical protein
MSIALEISNSSTIFYTYMTRTHGIGRKMKRFLYRNLRNLIWLLKTFFPSFGAKIRSLQRVI